MVDLSLRVERHYEPDRQAMLAALRVVLGLARQPKRTGQEDR